MSAEVDAIDPSTGASHTVASFKSPASTVFIDPSIVANTYGSSPMHRAMFSPGWDSKDYGRYLELATSIQSTWCPREPSRDSAPTHVIEYALFKLGGKPEAKPLDRPHSIDGR